MQSLALDVCVQDKDGKDINLSELCQDDDGYSSRDHGGNDFARHYTEEEIRRAFQIEGPDELTPDGAAEDEDDLTDEALGIEEELYGNDADADGNDEE